MGFWATTWDMIGTDILKKGLSGLAPGGEGPGSPPVQFPSYSHLKVGMGTPSKAGEAEEIETADVTKINDWNWRLFNPPYQKTQIVIPRITDRVG